MPSLSEEFAAEQETKAQSRKFQLEEDFRAYLKDQAQGGSITQATVPANPPVGAVVGGVGTTLATGNPALGVLGAVAGEAGQQLVERAIGSPAAPQTTEEAALRMTREGLTQGAVEVIGGAGSFLMDKARAFAPFAKTVTPEAKEAMAFVKARGGGESSLLPAEMTSNRFLDILQNISEHSLLGGGAIAKFKLDRDAFNTELAQTIVQRHGIHMDADAVGRAVVDAATKNLEAAKYQSKFIYEAIESQAAPEYARAPVKMTVKRTESKREGKAPTESDAYGPTLIEFLRSKGGIRDQGGEIARLEMKGKPFQKNLIQEEGMGLDTAAELAVQAGYLPERDVNALINAIERESRGTPTYSPANTKIGAEDDLIQQAFDVKTGFQDIQVGDKLERLRVMMTDRETQVGGTRIDLRPLKDDLENMTRTSKEAGGLADAAMGNTLLAFINQKPDLVSYPVAKAIRTEVRAYRDQLKGSLETKNAPGIGKADTVYGKLTERIRAGLADDDPFLATMWDEANLIEAGANQQFNTKFIRELVKLADQRGGGAPEAIVEKVWRAGRPTQIKVVRNALDPLTWGKMQRVELEGLMKQAMPNGVPDGKAMERVLFGKDGIGEEALKAGFDPKTVEELKGFVNALKVQQAKAPDGTGRVWIQLAQATTAVQALGAGAAVLGLTSDEYGGPGLTAAGTAILLGPAVVARIMSHPSGIQWLTTGLTASPKSAKYINAVTQISKALEAGIPRPGPAREPVAPRPSTQLPGMPVQE